MPKDLKYIIKQVIKRYGSWPKDATAVRLDIDGEVCSTTSSGNGELDFFPKNILKAKCKFIPSLQCRAVGTKYNKEQFEQGNK